MTVLEVRPDLEPLLLTGDEFDALTVRQQRTYMEAMHRLSQWRPVLLEPKQQLAEEMTSLVDELLYGGAAGGGKSAWLIHHQHTLAAKHKGHRGLHLRATHPEIEMSTLPDAFEFYASLPAKERPTWRAGMKRWEYPNGSWIQYGHLERPQHVYRYLSTAWDCITIDELTEIEEDPFELLMTRARNTEEKRLRGITPHFAGASNPGNKGHGWVKARFPLEQAGPYGPEGEPGGVEVIRRTFWSPAKQEWQDVEGHIRRIKVDMPDGTVEYKTVGFVRSTVLDNPHQSRDYIRQLSASGEVRRRQYLEGDWSVFEGQYFDEFREVKLVAADGEPAEHGDVRDGLDLVQWHVIDPFDIPNDWYRAHAVDHGFAHPFGALWGAWDDDGRLFIYLEHAEAHLVPSEQAARVLGKMPKQPSKGLGDPKNWSKLAYDTRGPTIAKQWADAGLKLSKAKIGGDDANSRVSGWQKVREYLMPGPVVINGKATKRPWVAIMSNCTELIRTLPIQVFDPNKPEDLLKNDDDNLVDCLRFLCTHKPRRLKTMRLEQPSDLNAKEKQHMEQLLKQSRRRRPMIDGGI